MTKGQPLTSQHYWQRKRWPFYRGRRAGMQVKARELYRRHNIDKVRPRPMDREARRPSSAHNPNNCVQVSTTNSIQKTPISLNAFVPALLLSNVMSLAPKIDEVREAISNANLDLACITETWLRNHIHNNVIAVSGYNLVRRDRTKDQHGGVCIFIKDSIKYQVLEDLMDDEFEVSTTNSIQKTPISLNAFVPALLLSNVMSLAPKIDEVREAISNANLDLACITETWLRNHIHNNVIAVSGYNLVRRDRTKDQHGGVCILIKDSIKYQVLEDLMDDEFASNCDLRVSQGESQASLLV
ncbi:predicted protein [Nematostella vectensis]|uniref:Endonuclease/exonuclease/phosphatase domain-containing protein n=1 Tax=Nematostella vectensis TaxID=45351 RepID=A7RML8_NEMVE|nr:predicted protein [Nematostella vectensis]|eukprot:XP_001639429.1 predicted protein [Nematostella vectensis]